MTILASYSNPSRANHVYEQLLDSGVSRESISVIANEKSINEMNENKSDHDKVVKESTGAAITGAIGGASLAFLAGAAVLTGLPGFLIGGSLAAALTSLGANAAVGAAIGSLGGLASGLIKAGINEADAKSAEETVNQGGVVLTVVEDAAGNAERVIKASNPLRISTIQ